MTKEQIAASYSRNINSTNALTSHQRNYVKAIAINYGSFGGRGVPVWNKLKVGMAYEDATATKSVFSDTRKKIPFKPNVPFHNTDNVQLNIDGLLKLPDIIQNEIYDAYLYELLLVIRDKTPVDTGRAQRGWEIVNDTIINPVPYVKYLELGTTRTRPIGMVSTTISASQRILDLVVSRYLNK